MSGMAPDSEHQSLLCLRAKASILYEKSAQLVAQWDPSESHAYAIYTRGSDCGGPIFTQTTPPSRLGSARLTRASISSRLQFRRLYRRPRCARTLCVACSLFIHCVSARPSNCILRSLKAVPRRTTRHSQLQARLWRFYKAYRCRS